MNPIEPTEPTEITIMDALRIDGVTSPANGTEFLLMKALAEDDCPMTAVALIKSVDEQQFTLGLAYPAGRADIARARDGHIDVASAEVVEKAAWRWMLKSQDVGLFHQDGTGGRGKVVESSIHRGPDWVMKGAGGAETTITAGDWLLGVIWDDPAWSLVKAGHVRGFSPQGYASRAPLAKDALPPYGVPDMDALAPVRWT